MIILIPAYRPDESLVELCKKLISRVSSSQSRIEILIVDDGSGEKYSPIFRVAEALSYRVRILTLAENGGKGAALRAGFTWCRENRAGQCVITADADGQHLAADILAVGVATELRAQQSLSAMVLGVRTVDDPLAPEPARAPLRSRWGNAVSVAFFRLATGQKVIDTQTGLRGFTPELLPWLDMIPGNRYDYEFTMLLRATRTDMLIEQVAITKVYEPGNPTSHFRPVRDSLKIYAPLLGFLATSLAGFAIDTVALLSFVAWGMHVVPAVICARLVSALCNFALNRVILHDGGAAPATRTSLVRYGVLAAGILATNAGLMELLTWAGRPLIVVKVLVEATLVPLSFAAQKRWVFGERETALETLRPDASFATRAPVAASQGELPPARRRRELVG